MSGRYEGCIAYLDEVLSLLNATAGLLLQGSHSPDRMAPLVIDAMDDIEKLQAQMLQLDHASERARA